MKMAFLLIRHCYEFKFIWKMRNAENLEKSMFSAMFSASLRGFEPPTYRLGVAPIRHREVTSNAKKCLEIQGFSAFQILSDTTL